MSSGFDAAAVAFTVAGSFCFFASLVSSVTIYQTLQYNSNDLLRHYVVRILLMVPFYSIQSWLGLRFISASLCFDVLREIYEAVVIYSFYQFLVVYLGGEEYLCVSLSRKEPQPHLFPFTLMCSLWRPGREMLYATKVGTLQYVVVKPVLAVIIFTLESLDLYGEGSFRADVGYPYVTFFANLSQVYALYCLLIFFLVTQKDLQPIRPVAKFLIVKAVVFFTWWQGIVVAVLVAVLPSGIIPQIRAYSVDNIAKGFQDFVICIEMAPLALLFYFAFPPREFYDVNMLPLASESANPSLRSLLAITNPIDLVKDVSTVVTRSYNSHHHLEEMGTSLHPVSEMGLASADQPLLSSSSNRISKDSVDGDGDGLNEEDGI